VWDLQGGEMTAPDDTVSVLKNLVDAAKRLMETPNFIGARLLMTGALADAESLLGELQKGGGK
jgi:hypothetical protein